MLGNLIAHMMMAIITTIAGLWCLFNDHEYVAILFGVSAVVWLSFIFYDR